MKSTRQTDSALAVAYIRVSTDDQNLGPDAQRASIAAWAARQGVRVAAWFTDKGVSGGKAVEDRPALLESLQALRTHRAGLLVAAKRDRIARDVVVAATVERLAQDAGARVVTADGVSAEDTPEGMLMRNLMDAFASYERAVIRSRTKAALAVKRARGERLGGDVPVGYRVEGRNLVASEDEQVAASIRPPWPARSAGPWPHDRAAGSTSNQGHRVGVHVPALRPSMDRCRR